MSTNYNKIQGSLVVSQLNWRFVYNSILNYANQEVQSAYALALELYDLINSSEGDPSAFFESKKVNNFQKLLITNALFRQDNSNVYKPKKRNFPKITNRTTELDFIDIKVQFEKVLNTITFTSSEFEDFDTFIATNSFVSEFINMVSTITWPSKSGPVKAVRGCTLAKLSQELPPIVFYTAGTNPPVIQNAQSEVVEEPIFIKTSVDNTITHQLPFTLSDDDSSDFNIETVDEDLF